MTDRRFAVIIGLNSPGAYVDLPSLRFAEKDARDVRDVLTDPEIGTFDSADVQLFVGPDTTAAAVKAALRNLVIDADPSDVLLIYFAGHTLATRWSRGTDTYLVTPDLDKAALSENPDAGVRLAFLKRDVLERFAGTALLILDCCRAGSLLEAPGPDVEMIGFEGRRTAGYSALMACRADGVAREDPVRGHGNLTYHVLRALGGAARDDQGRVTFTRMGGYVLDQGLDPAPGLTTQIWGSNTVLTYPGRDEVGKHASPPLPAEVTVLELGNPLDRSVPAISRLVERLVRAARVPRQHGTDEGAAATVSRVSYVKSAMGAESVAYLEHTPGGLTIIDATARFDRDDVQPLLRSGAGASFPSSQVWFGHVAHDGGRRVVCVPLRHVEGKSQLLALVNPAQDVVELGQPVAKILEAVWQTDFTAAPEEAEIQVLTALRAAFGRLPGPLYERCFQLYRQLLESFSMVFQPVITIGKLARNVSVHSYEALARRSPTDQRAPVSLLKIAHVWGDRFVIERDEIILRKSLAAYARAHADGPWDLPKPVSVNVAVRSLLSDSYVETLRQSIAAATHLDGSVVTLEIAEQDPIEPRAGEQWPEEPHAYFHRRLAAISRDLGVTFAVDDFGVGYSTLSRMSGLPLTEIKVDRAVLHHPTALRALQFVVDIARYGSDRGDTSAPRMVVVEGVDEASPVTLRQIFELRIKHVQGYITREPAAPVLRPLSDEVREHIAALVRGDDEKRQAEAARRDHPGDGHTLRRGA